MALQRIPTIAFEEPSELAIVQEVVSPAESSNMTSTTPAMLIEPKKPRGRDRLFRGLHRIASSTSLTRARADSGGYNGLGRGSMSCISLSSPVPPLSPSSYGHSYTNSYSSSSSAGFSTAPTSQPATPGADMGFLEFRNKRAIPRPVTKSRPQTPLTAPLPSELRWGRFTRTPTATTPVINELEVSGDYFSLPVEKLRPRRNFDFWGGMPDEIKIRVFSFLEPKEIIKASAVSKQWQSWCFDGQLWTKLDFSRIYRDISPESLVKIMTNAGPFAKELNLRGCVQMRERWQLDGPRITDLCRNLQYFSLEGCKTDRSTVHQFLVRNPRLVHLNLSGLSTISNSTMKILAQACPQLRYLDVSWCAQINAQGLHHVVQSCPKLTELRASKIQGWNHEPLLLDLFERNTLERLVLGHCSDFDESSLLLLTQGRDPPIDPLTDRAIVTPRRFRHLDFTGCKLLTDTALRALHFSVPRLQGLCLHGCTAITDAGLEPLFPNVPYLTHLDLEELNDLTNSTLTALAAAPCAPHLKHLSISYCESLGDTGILPILRSCPRLINLEVDNTRISDLALHEAAAQVRSRNLAAARPNSTGKPLLGLRLVAYDCSNVTWTGVRAVLAHNAEFFRRGNEAGTAAPVYPVRVINLKCFYGFQPTVDEHTKRVLMGELARATMLERKWAEWMISTEEAGAQGAGGWRRRRRAREAERQVEGEGDGIGPGGRRRARSGGCVVM